MARQFLRRLLSSFNLRIYILIHHSPQWAQKYHFAELKITELANCSRREGWNSVSWSHTPESNLCKLLSSYYLRIIIWGYFLFPHGPLWAPKYHFADSTKRVLANCFWELSCNTVKGIHRSQRSQKVSFWFWTDDISFISVGLNVIQISPLRFLKNSDNGLLPETYV